MSEPGFSQEFGELLDWLVAAQAGQVAHEVSARGNVTGQEAGLVATAERLARLPSLLPPADVAFEQRVRQRLATMGLETGPNRARPAWRVPALRWLAPLAALALFALLVLPGPRAALGNWMARLRLRDVDVVVIPEAQDRPVQLVERQTFATLAEAEADAGFHLIAPAALPAGSHLIDVAAVSYEQLPSWLRPLYVESRYQQPDAQPDVYFLVLRQYNASRPDDIHVDAIEYQSEDVSEIRELALADGNRAVLLVFRASSAHSQYELKELIWEANGMTFELWSEFLPTEELTRIAESMR